VFFSNTAGAAPDTLTFQLHRKRIDTIASFFDNSTLTLAGKNFLPSLLSPFIPAKYSTVYVDGPQLTLARNDQTAFDPKEIGVLTSDKSGWGKIYLEKKGGDYYLSFPDLPRAGEYNGKIPSDFISTAVVSVKVKVADLALYLLLTVLAGILVSNQMTKQPLTSSRNVNAFIVAASSVLSVLVTHFALYTDTWGSTLDYVKAFAAGAGINLASKSGLALAHRIARRW
jgi:hypothetical protein